MILLKPGHAFPASARGRHRTHQLAAYFTGSDPNLQAYRFPGSSDSLAGDPF
jgi:hypothetical protein